MLHSNIYWMNNVMISFPFFILEFSIFLRKLHWSPNDWIKFPCRSVINAVLSDLTYWYLSKDLIKSSSCWLFFRFVWVSSYVKSDKIISLLSVACFLNVCPSILSQAQRVLYLLLSRFIIFYNSGRLYHAGNVSLTNQCTLLYNIAWIYDEPLFFLGKL